MNDEQLRYFGFQRPPFGTITDPRELFQTNSAGELIDAIVCDIIDGKRIIGVRGVRGGGKTCFSWLLAAEISGRQMRGVHLDAASACPQAAQKLLGQAAGMTGEMPDPARLLVSLQHEYCTRRLAVIIDGAELLGAPMLRYLWHMSELCRRQGIRLHLVLIGGLGTWPGLDAPGLEDMRRASLSDHMIPGLSDDEAEDYLDHRLRGAGRSLADLFTRRAAVELIGQSACSPARLNSLTETALVHGYGIRARRINVRRLAAALAISPSWRLVDGLRSFVPIPVAAGLACIAVAAWIGGLAFETDAGIAARAHAGGAIANSTIVAAAPPESATAAAPGLVRTGQAVIAAQDPDAIERPPTRGLVLIAAEGDNIANLYSRVYRGLEPPPYEEVVAANKWPIKAGSLVIFPEPPHGWGTR